MPAQKSATIDANKRGIGKSCCLEWLTAIAFRSLNFLRAGHPVAIL